jgi:sugar/nucleoside kinase (ribokinase family)
LSVEALDEQQIRDAAVLYLEAYLWRPAGPRAAMKRAIEVAKDAGRKVALTMSDIACIASARDSFLEIIGDGAVDLLFANENEIKALAGIEDFDAAVERFTGEVPLMVVTCSEKGAIGVENGRRASVAADRVDGVVDTTGAGDLFAAGFLAGHAEGRPIEQCLRMGSIAAAEIISHFGARPERDLRALMAEKLAG